MYAYVCNCMYIYIYILRVYIYVYIHGICVICVYDSICTNMYIVSIGCVNAMSSAHSI